MLNILIHIHVGCCYINNKCLFPEGSKTIEMTSSCKGKEHGVIEMFKGKQLKCRNRNVEYGLL